MLETSIATMAEGLRLAAAFLAPVMPGVVHEIYALLDLDRIGTWDEELTWGNRLDGRTPGEKTILFPRPQEG